MKDLTPPKSSLDPIEIASRDEIEASWNWCDTLLDAWDDKKIGTKSYSAGSWGPSKAEILIENDGRSWYEGK